MPPEGLEQAQDSKGNSTDIEKCGAKSGAESYHSGISDQELLKIIKVWPKLPLACQKALLAIVESVHAEK